MCVVWAYTVCVCICVLACVHVCVHACVHACVPAEGEERELFACSVYVCVHEREHAEEEESKHSSGWGGRGKGIAPYTLHTWLQLQDATHRAAEEICTLPVHICTRAGTLY